MKINLLFIAIAFFTLIGCTKSTFEIDDTIVVDYDKSVIVRTESQELIIKYIELTEESRCPPKHTCVWAGEVAIKLSVNEEEFMLGLHQDYSSSISYDNYTITLVNVEYNKNRNFGKKSKSHLELIVE